jgi:hypothetical protein
MRTISVQCGPLTAPSATNIRTASGVLAAGPIVLNGSLVSGGVAILDTARHILFTTTADETTKTATVTGTNWSGSPISETVTLVNNSTVATVLDFKTATITVSAALTGNLSVGTNGLAGSAWVQIDPWAMVPVAVQVTVSGTVNYDIEVCNDDPNDYANPVLPANMNWMNAPDTALVAKTAAALGTIAAPWLWARLILNSQTNPGYAIATFTQPSSVPQ